MPAEATLTFSRLSQIGLLRLLTTRALMGNDVLTQAQAQAWSAYHSLFSSDRVLFAEEPKALEERFRLRTDRAETSPKLWADAYLAAFAEESGLTLVTLDHALARSVRGAVLLKES